MVVYFNKHWYFVVPLFWSVSLSVLVSAYYMYFNLTLSFTVKHFGFKCEMKMTYLLTLFCLCQSGGILLYCVVYHSGGILLYSVLDRPHDCTRFFPSHFPGP